MKERLTLEMVLAFAVLALGIFAYGESASPAWWWMVLLGAALALVVFVDAWSERHTRYQRPVTLRTSAFIAAELVLPVLVLAASALALTEGGEVWYDAAIVLAVALAIFALL
ncbi:hypothetical protein [Hyphomicrobium sp. CS1GBMeth3]|uniref:hypothetical protein n=1 Tax=Hyphomicrobium sp. CS1GBMeth3 TaxID=1892845 RepID=UPI00093009F6|nr:hypothetical protein [Hyphomicrobium sp. CS1GBMeth3]